MGRGKGEGGGKDAPTVRLNKNPAWHGGRDRRALREGLLPEMEELISIHICLNKTKTSLRARWVISISTLALSLRDDDEDEADDGAELLHLWLW